MTEHETQEEQIQGFPDCYEAQAQQYLETVKAKTNLETIKTNYKDFSQIFLEAVGPQWTYLTSLGSFLLLSSLLFILDIIYLYWSTFLFQNLLLCT